MTRPPEEDDPEARLEACIEYGEELIELAARVYVNALPHLEEGESFEQLARDSLRAATVFETTMETFRRAIREGKDPTK